MNRKEAELLMNKIALPLVLFVFCALIVSACSGKQYRNGVFEDKKNAYRIEAPGKAWKQIESEDTNLAFFNDSLNAVIMVNSTCDEYKDAPASALTGHLFIGIEDRKVLEQQKVMLDGREAVYTLVEGKLDGAPVKLATYVLVKNYCIYDLAYSAPPASFERGLPYLKNIADKFKVLRRKD